MKPSKLPFNASVTFRYRGILALVILLWILCGCASLSNWVWHSDWQHYFGLINSCHSSKS
jgi:hypothetical protein